MNDKQIIQEMNLNLTHQITKGSVEHQLCQVVTFVFGGAFNEIYLKLSRTNGGSA